MQLIAEKRIVHRPKKPESSVSVIVTRRQQTSVLTAVVKPMPVRFESRQAEEPCDFSKWNMPEQETGVIKCREHEFW